MSPANKPRLFCLPVWKKIPKTLDAATYVLPVRTLNTAQLVRNLGTLFPDDVQITANDNSLLVTGPQTEIRRLAEIVTTLDSVSFSINQLKVYPLKWADAKSMAGMIKELFGSQEPSGAGAAGRGNNNASRFNAGATAFGQRGFFGRGLPTTDAGGESGNGEGAANRVSAIADDRSNSLILSAPDSLIVTIDEMVARLDRSVEDVTVVKTIVLQNADATETANLLMSIFGDDTASSDATRTVQVNRGGQTGRGAVPVTPPANGASDRMQKLGHVVVTPDPRTSRLVISASKALMPQIEEVVASLDSDPAMKTELHTIRLKNADPMETAAMIMDIFPSGSTTASSSSPMSQMNLLTTRATTLSTQFNSQGSQTQSGGGSGGRGTALP